MKLQRKDLYYESVLLRRLRRRTSSLLLEGAHYPFIEPLSFAAYENGAMLAMSNAGSMTLYKLLVHHMSNGFSKKMPELLAAHYLVQILSAVAILHKCNMLHCDLKLDNIGVLGEGRFAWLLDF